MRRRDRRVRAGAALLVSATATGRPYGTIAALLALGRAKPLRTRAVPTRVVYGGLVRHRVNGKPHWRSPR